MPKHHSPWCQYPMSTCGRWGEETSGTWVQPEHVLTPVPIVLPLALTLPQHIQASFSMLLPLPMTKSSVQTEAPWAGQAHEAGATQPLSWHLHLLQHLLMIHSCLWSHAHPSFNISWSRVCRSMHNQQLGFQFGPSFAGWIFVGEGSVIMMYCWCVLRHSSRVSRPKISPSASSVLCFYQSHAYKLTRWLGLFVATPSSNVAKREKWNPRGRWATLMSAKDQRRIGTSITRLMAVLMPTQDMTYICHICQWYIPLGTILTYKLGIENFLHPLLFYKVCLVNL